MLLANALYINQNQTLTVDLQFSNEIEVITTKDIVVEYTGSAVCDQVIINAMSHLHIQVHIEKCRGEGHLKLKAGGNYLTTIYVNNSLFPVSYPISFYLNSSKDNIYMFDFNLMAIQEISFPEGDVRILSGLNNGTGVGLADYSSQITINANEDKAYLASVNKKSIIAVDLTSGDRKIISSNTIGTGAAYGNPTTVTLSHNPNKVYVLDDFSGGQVSGTIFEVDLITGNRTIISNHDLASGPYLISIFDFVINSAETKGYATGKAIIGNHNFIDIVQEVLMEINLLTGKQTIISSYKFRGDGPKLDIPLRLQLDEKTSKIRILDKNIENSKLLEIDIDSGDRRVLIDKSIGSGQSFININDFFFLPDENSVYLLDAASSTILNVDLSTKHRTILFNNLRGYGEQLIGPGDLILSHDRKHILGIDSGSKRLYILDILTGDRKILTDSYVGSDPAIHSTSFVVNSEQTLAFALNIDFNTLVKINLLTGARELVSGGGIGTGSSFQYPTDLFLDESTNTIYVIAGRSNALFKVDLNTGNRSIISSTSQGTGQNFIFPAYLTVDLIKNFAYVVDFDTIFQVDLVTGNRNVLASRSIGSGVSFGTLVDISIDSTGNSIYVLDNYNKALIQINVDTGLRSVVIDNNSHEGVSLVSPTGFAIDDADEKIYISDQYLKSILTVDMVSGKRIISSR